MIREMRRKGQALSPEECLAVLERATSGVLAVAGDDEYPYAVPLSFAIDGNRLYFHCAREGHKLDAIRRHAKVSFCVVDRDEVIPETYTTHFRSVILFGQARVLDDPSDKRAAMEKLAAKYSPGLEDGYRAAIEGALAQFCMVEIAIDHMTGKEARELAKRSGR